MSYQQDKFGEADFWDKIAGQRIYAAFDDEEYAQVIDEVMGKDLSGKVIYDIGSASGVSAALFAARGANVIGIDISPKLIEQANNLWQNYHDRISFKVGDAEKIDLPENSADFVFYGGVLHHFPDRSRVYSEALRLLKDSGKIVAMEPNKLDFFERIEWFVAGLRNKLAPSEYPINPLEFCAELTDLGMQDANFYTFRKDIPVLNQIPILKYIFSRKRGFWLKSPIVAFVDLFRKPSACGTFFVGFAKKAK